MKETQVKHKPKKPFVYSRLFLAFLFVVVIFLARGTWGIYMKERESRHNAAQVKLELQVLGERHEALLKQTNKLKTEQGVEQALREKFPVSKENEKVIVIIDEKIEDVEVVEKEGFSAFWSRMTGWLKPKP